MNEKRPIFCNKHKKDNMVDVVSKKCIENECNKQPVFNYINETTPIYCKTHKKENMIDIKNKKCIENECNKQPVFNYKDETTPIYCNIHKKDDMINIKSKKCIELNCNIRPSFNYENEIEPLYCTTHKKDNMVNILKNNKCIELNCNVCASFNYKNETKPIYCFKHKKDEMISIIHILCNYDNCNLRPSFNYDNEIKPLYFAKHKHNNMIDVVHKMCKTYICNTIISNSTYEGYCLRCYVNIFPDRPNSRNYKTKELNVIEFIKSSFNDKTIISDKKIQDGCSRRRPDILIDLGYQIIIIEVDENQHIDYDCSCENKRIMELSQDVGHRPLIFIRFNPDEYLDKENNKITSCWNINTKGLCCIKKSKVKEWNERLNVLKDSINYWINNKTDKTVEIIQLYFNQIV
jgi:hypothetical protein